METEPKFPSTICVSELLRTWETAILLFLKEGNTNLTLFISPFLREDGLFPSDSPGILEDQLYEFMRFLVFLGQLKKFTKNETQDIKDLFSWIPNSFTITFKHYSGSFTDDFIGRIRGTQLFKLNANNGALEIKCPSISSITLDKFITEGMLDTLQKLYDGILVANSLKDVSVKKDRIVVQGSNSGEGKYTEYSNDTSKMLTYPSPELIPEFNDNNLNQVSSPPSIRTFAKWCKNNIDKIRDPSGIVYFVSHSHIMQAFVKKVIKLSYEPNDSFIAVYDKANKTNSWSLFFNVEEVKFKGFRHAFSCDNRYDKKGLVKILHRVALGSYTNLALWGILSTAIFAKRKIPGLIKDNDPQTLKVSVGMVKESKPFLADTYDKFNMLCGKMDDRFKTSNFEITLSNCGTSSKLTLTLDNDCIKIKYRQDNGTFDPKKVVLQLSKNDPRVIEVKFFKDDSNTYTPPSDKEPTTSLLKIASFLSGTSIPARPIDDENNRYDELKALTLEMTELISNFINSDVFKKTKNNTTWADLFKPLSKEIEANINDSDSEFSGGGGRGLFGRRTKKMRKYKKYTKKYYTPQSRKKSRRIRKHRRKSRKSRRSRK